MKTIIAVVLALMLVPGVASAWTGNDLVLSGEAGQGVNTSYLVIDFGSASYAFKYKWTQITEVIPTGFDLISALADAQTGVPGFSFSYHTEGGMGAMIDTISYDGHSGTSAYPAAFWNYWTGPAGGPIGYSWYGVSASPISNGSVDAWVFSDNWEQQPAIPGVPEPSSMIAMISLIGLAGSAKLLRGRSR